MYCVDAVSILQSLSLWATVHLKEEHQIKNYTNTWRDARELHRN